MSRCGQGTVLREIHRVFNSGTIWGLSEEELLARFVAKRDEAAFAALIARHGPMILGVCRRWLRDPRDVEDAFQATALIFIRKAGSIRRPHLLSAWLHGVACRVARRTRIVAARRGQREQTGNPAAESATTTDPGLDLQNELRSAIDQEIGRLPERLRLPVVLCLLEGRTQAEAAEQLRITPDSVRGRLERARVKLRERLSRRGFGLPSGVLALDLAAETASAALPVVIVEKSLRLLTVGPTSSVALLTRGLGHAMTFQTWKPIAGVLLISGVTTAVLAGLVARVPVEKAKAATTRNPPPKHVVPAPVPPVIRVEARDLVTNEAVPGVELKLVARPGDARYHAVTDANGAVRFDLAGMGKVEDAQVIAKCEGYVPLVIGWVSTHSPDYPKLPDPFLFQMEKVTTVSGRVLDQDQQPVSGAVVVIAVNKHYPKSEQWVGVNYDTTTTDAEGRWSFTNVPAAPDAVKLTTFHALHLTEESSFHVEEFTPLNALRDGTAVLTLPPRGTIVAGKVVSEDGEPVSDAEVFYGAGRRYGNSMEPFKTDAQGRFTLGIKPGTNTSLTVRHPGFSPAGLALRVGSKSEQITLTLQPSRTLTGRVVDSKGKPIADAWLTAGWSPLENPHSSRGRETLAVKLETDADGRFTWNDAPADKIAAEVFASDYLGRSDVELIQGQENRIVLTAATAIKGTVIDDATGEPIADFDLAQGAVWHPDEPLIWQGLESMEDAKKSPGAFTYTFLDSAETYVVRVSADEYLPSESKPFSPDGTTRELTFRLTRAEPIHGRVANPDGTPAREGIVYLVPSGEQFDMLNGVVDDHVHRSAIHATVNPGGSFTLPPQKTNFSLVALSDAGMVIVRRRELQDGRPIRLRPWCRVTGTVTTDGVPQADVALSGSPNGEIRDEDGFAILDRYYIKTDRAGRFTFPRVSSGRHTFGQWVPNGKQRRIWFVDMASIDAQGGQSHDLRIGESGRAFTGRLALPEVDEWMIRKAEIKPSNAKEDARIPGVHVFDDGRFRADDLPDGDYTMRIDIHQSPDADQCGWGRRIATYIHDFTVSKDAGPLDLGRLEPVAVGGVTLQVGDLAPPFAAKTLDGENLTLDGVRGKFVLVDFWATWCAPCVAELPNLKNLHDTFGSDPRFVMISLSLDDNPDDVRRFLKSQDFPWPQCLIGPDSDVVASYGASAIPSTFLIGPDGRIVAKDLRGSGTKSAVADALAGVHAKD